MKNSLGKRIGAIAMAGLMGLSLTACSSSAADSSESAKDVETLTVLMYTDWYKSGWEALEKHINDHADELGFKLEISKIQGGNQGDQVVKRKMVPMFTECRMLL